MQSEKAMYWVTLGVLALSATSGLVSQHRALGEGLVHRSVAMMAQASGLAVTYAGLAGMALGREGDLAQSPQVAERVYARLACVQSTLARRQAEMARWQAVKVRVRMVERVPRTIVLRHQYMVIEVPQSPRIQVDRF